MKSDSFYGTGITVVKLDLIGASALERLSFLREETGWKLGSLLLWHDIIAGISEKEQLQILRLRLAQRTRQSSLRMTSGFEQNDSQY
ncbi:MAG: hypothetical protein P4K83_02420 [Terracidiphilus sp.]|nr:hypothetical protein [Terracidiphilus sp.]